METTLFQFVRNSFVLRAIYDKERRSSAGPCSHRRNRAAFNSFFLSFFLSLSLSLSLSLFRLRFGVPAAVSQKLQLITATYAPYILDDRPAAYLRATKNFQLAIKRSSLELSPPHSRRSTENNRPIPSDSVLKPILYLLTYRSTHLLLSPLHTITLSLCLSSVLLWPHAIYVIELERRIPIEPIPRSPVASTAERFDRGTLCFTSR